MLLGIHVMLAGMTQVPEFMLDPKEAAALSSAIKQVNDFYPMMVDPRKVAVVQLCVVAGGIYGTHFMAWRKRTAAAAPQRPTAAAPSSAPAAAPSSTAAAPSSAAAPVVDILSRAKNPSDLWKESAVLPNGYSPS